MAAGTRRAQADSHTESEARTTWRVLSDWAGPVALLIALIAVALAGWALATAGPGAPASAGDSKTSVCNAVETVGKAVQIQTNADLGPDPVAQRAVAGNARLAIFGGGDYLLRRLGPNTPKELDDAVRAFADNLQDIGMNALADVPNTDPAQAARLRDGEASRIRIAQLCK
jgi:hypothetical protein